MCEIQTKLSGMLLGGHACSSRIQEAETGGSPQILGQPGLYSKLWDGMG